MQLYGFTARDCDRLHALLAAYEQGRIRVDVPAFARQNSHQQDSFLGSTSGTITAGHTGTATMVGLDTAVPPNETALTGITFPVFNPSSSDLPAGTYLFTLEPSQGYYCPSFAGSSTPSFGSFNYASSGGVSITSTLWASQATVFSVTLPSSGTYLLFVNVWAEIKATSASGSGSLWCQLYDATLSSPIGDIFGPAGIVASPNSTSAFCSTGTMIVPYAASGADAITIRAAMSTSQVNATLFADGNGPLSTIGYLKLA